MSEHIADIFDLLGAVAQAFVYGLAVFAVALVILLAVVWIWTAWRDQRRHAHNSGGRHD